MATWTDNKKQKTYHFHVEHTRSMPPTSKEVQPRTTFKTMLKAERDFPAKSKVRKKWDSRAQ